MTIKTLNTTAQDPVGAINDVHGEVNTNTSDIATLDDKVNVTEVTVSSVSYTLANVRTKLYVDYTSTAPVEIEIPSSFIANANFKLELYDTGNNAGINNITIVTEGSELIQTSPDGFIINADGEDFGFITLTTDGTDVYVG